MIINLDELNQIRDEAYKAGVSAENTRISRKIIERISDLQACGKSNDNCAEFAHYIESYLEEWLDDEL